MKDNTALVMLANIAKDVSRFKEDGAYPVLGAEESVFRIEVSSGDIDNRRVHVQFAVFFETGASVEISGYSTEAGTRKFDMTLPEAAHLVAFLDLLVRVLGKDVKIPNPEKI
jgi:hypothetical protein